MGQQKPPKSEQLPEDLGDHTKIRVYFMLIMLIQTETSTLIQALKNLKSLVGENRSFILNDCFECLSILSLLLLMQNSEISQLSLTIMLALSFDNFASYMTERQIFDVFQLAFLKLKEETFTSDYVIILQKISQKEPQGLLASVNGETIKTLNRIVAVNQDQFLV